ncbi:helix-turn-helix domain-containing protein [Bosea sp. SSUT16]|uniref:Helix-turn-helix domain-containing protein n=1 Tax=Bosea spartocytisi TaxID=2773451 RepID=A0A927E795_9HYPH|nr:Cro/CI family transcriptional regulator [Bosea spartocytisi]MBD3844246.1 helix-turn-helix domain-containing protein [Bosea spartocytisi]MCT4470646.1 helix-turn-helix domain-containing protein [Bosea spartocytisi]
MTDIALRKAIEAAGGPVALSRELGVSSQAIAQWKQAPPLRVIDIERITGISRHDLRPDVFGAKPSEGRAA